MEPTSRQRVGVCGDGSKDRCQEEGRQKQESKVSWALLALWGPGQGQASTGCRLCVVLVHSGASVNKGARARAGAAVGSACSPGRPHAHAQPTDHGTTCTYHPCPARRPPSGAPSTVLPLCCGAGIRCWPLVPPLHARLQTARVVCALWQALRRRPEARPCPTTAPRGLTGAMHENAAGCHSLPPCAGRAS